MSLENLNGLALEKNWFSISSARRNSHSSRAGHLPTVLSCALFKTWRHWRSVPDSVEISKKIYRSSTDRQWQNGGNAQHSEAETQILPTEPFQPIHENFWINLRIIGNNSAALSAVANCWQCSRQARRQPVHHRVEL